MSGRALKRTGRIYYTAWSRGAFFGVILYTTVRHGSKEDIFHVHRSDKIDKYEEERNVRDETVLMKGVYF